MRIALPKPKKRWVFGLLAVLTIVGAFAVWFTAGTGKSEDFSSAGRNSYTTAPSPSVSSSRHGGVVIVPFSPTPDDSSYSPSPSPVVSYSPTPSQEPSTNTGACSELMLIMHKLDVMMDQAEANMAILRLSGDPHDMIHFAMEQSTWNNAHAEFEKALSMYRLLECQPYITGRW